MSDLSPDVFSGKEALSAALQCAVCAPDEDRCEAFIRVIDEREAKDDLKDLYGIVGNADDTGKPRKIPNNGVHSSFRSILYQLTT